MLNKILNIMSKIEYFVISKKGFKITRNKEEADKYMEPSTIVQ